MAMDSKSVVDLIEASSGVHFSGFHMNGLVEQRHSSEVEQPTTSATENIHMHPFVIGIVGCPKLFSGYTHRQHAHT